PYTTLSRSPRHRLRQPLPRRLAARAATAPRATAPPGPQLPRPARGLGSGALRDRPRARRRRSRARRRRGHRPPPPRPRPAARRADRPTPSPPPRTPAPPGDRTPREHDVRVHRADENLPHEGQLAWKMAEVAFDPVEVEADVEEMIINRIIDNASVAIASVTRDPIVSARAQALSHPVSRGG